MTYLWETVNAVRSGVFHVVFLDASNNRIGSGTSFMSKRLLVTNGHVFDVPRATARVWLRRDGDQDLQQGVVLNRADFESRRVVASPKDEYDYAVLNIPELMKFSPHQFNIVHHTGKQIGQRVAFLGYPLEHMSLACHAGIISSFYRTGNTEIIQVDASVNPSNSGGPLFDPSTGDVVGIITRKATGLTDLFGKLRAVINQNIQFLQEPKGAYARIAGLSVDVVLIAGQRQMLETLDQIERSANVGIGYAFSCKHLLEEQAFFERQWPAS